MVDEFPRGGDTLLADINNPHHERQAVVEEFLYKGNTLMLFAEAGEGKSVIAIQLALSLTTATPLFGILAIPKPCIVYYMQMEADYFMYMERIGRMRGLIPIDTNYLWWDDVRNLNLRDERSMEQQIQMIKKTGAEVVIFDPIYKLVAGPIADELPSKQIIRFSDLLQTKTGATLVWVHHSKRPQHSSSGDLIQVDDPFYGSQWLKAHVDTSYQLRRGKGKGKEGRVTLYNKKDRGGDVLHEIPLHYDPLSYTCMAEHDPKRMSGEERVVMWLRQCKQSERLTGFEETLDQCKLSEAQLRRIQQRLVGNKALEVKQTPGKPSEWVAL
jgi:RecA-family ATPase